MRRRDFIPLICAVAALWPVAAYARQDDRVRALQIRVLRLQAEGAAEKIGQFIKEIENQVGWTTQLTWSASTIEQRRFDGLRLLRLVPATLGRGYHPAQLRTGPRPPANDKERMTNEPDLSG